MIKLINFTRFLWILQYLCFILRLFKGQLSWHNETKSSATVIQSSWSEVKVAQSCPTLCDLMDCIVHGILQARILEWVTFPFSRESSQPRDQTQVFCIEGRFFTSWTTREDQEYRSGSLSLLQHIFLAQELNRGLLHCRRILYQLSYQGSPSILAWRIPWTRGAWQATVCGVTRVGRDWTTKHSRALYKS